MAKVKEAFKMKYQGNKNAQIVEVAFAAGEEVQVLREFKNDACLVKKDNQVFNVPKKYIG
jgi:predicted nucleic acid-binding protein